MLFKCRLYCLNDKTGDHYNVFNTIKQAETPIDLKDKLNQCGYMSLEESDEEIVMARPVGCRDTEFIIATVMTPDDLNI